MNFLRKAPLAMLLAGLLVIGQTGCVGQENGQKAITDDSKVSQIQKGVSTKTEIQGLFGDPMGKTFAETGDETWIYSYNSAHVDPKTYIPIVGGFMGGATTKASSLQVTFDKNGVVKAYGVTNTGAQSGFGKM